MVRTSVSLLNPTEAAQFAITVVGEDLQANNGQTFGCEIAGKYLGRKVGEHLFAPLLQQAMKETKMTVACTKVVHVADGSFVEDLEQPLSAFVIPGEPTHFELTLQKWEEPEGKSPSTLSSLKLTPTFSRRSSSKDSGRSSGRSEDFSPALAEKSESGVVEMPIFIVHGR